MKKAAVGLACMLAAAPGHADSQQIVFGGSWTEQRFSLFSSNEFALNGDSLGVHSDRTVSLLWTSLPETSWNKREALWDWVVDRSAPDRAPTRRGASRSPRKPHLSSKRTFT